MTKDKTKPIEEKIRDFENNPKNKKAIVAYNLWIGLTDKEKSRMWSEWAEYFWVCGESDSAMDFNEMGLAWKAKDFNRVKELKQKAREFLEKRDFIKKPQCLDPYWYMNNQAVFAYTAMKREQENKVVRVDTEEDQIFN